MKFFKNIRHVFLDLEMTLIKSWDDPFNFNQDSIIRHWISSLSNSKSKLTKMHLFTWAIDQSSDLKFFNKAVLPAIEKEFGIKVSQIVHVDHCLTATKAVRKIQIFDHLEMSQILGKRDAFFDFCKYHGIRNAMLFDDTVENTTLKFNDETCIAETLNVSFIEKGSN